MGTITVTNLFDSGIGSLRAALAEAEANGASADEIRFEDSLAGGTITLGIFSNSYGGALQITSDLTIFGDIDGDGVSDITISGDANGNQTADGGDARFLDIANNLEVGVRGLTFDTGYASGELDPTSLINIGVGGNTIWYGNTVSNSFVVSQSQANNTGLAGADAAIIRNAGSGEFAYSVFTGNTVLAGYGSNGGDLSGPADGGDAVAGILNTSDGQIEVQDLGFDGLARGGKGGDGALGYNDTGGAGGAAVVGILNFGVLSNSRPHVAAIGVGSGSTVIGGGGGPGDDRFYLLGAAGDKRFYGGLGVDTFIAQLSPFSSGDGLALALNNAPVVSAPGLNITLYDIENITGTGANDVLVGNEQANFLYGGGGSDEIFGFGGDDVIVIDGPGDHLAIGGGGNDQIAVNNFGGGDQTITVVGEGERDLLSFTSTADLRIDLAVTTEQNIAPSSIDDIRLTVSGIEDISTFSGADVIQGTDQGNEIFTFDGADFVDGRGGDDTITGDASNVGVVVDEANDTLIGGAGRDQLFGFGGDDQIFGGRDGDSLEGGTGNDLLVGGAEDNSVDTLTGGDGNDTLFGGGGADILIGGDGDDVENGEAGNDGFEHSIGTNTIDGGADQDGIEFAGALADFAITVTSGVVIANGAGGISTIRNVESFAFADQTLTLSELEAIVNPPPDDVGDDGDGGGGSGDGAPGDGSPGATAGPTNGADRLTGTSGNDTINALGGDDTVRGEAGDDRLIGGAGNDNIRGGAGDDNIRGNAGDDRLIGNGGADNIRGNGGADNIKGGGGADNIRAGGGADTVKAGGGSDTVKGGGGADQIDGGGGADRLEGGGGGDVITGKGGDDTLVGGGGADIFQFRASDRDDTILDFRQGQDKIQILSGANLFQGLDIQQDGADVLIGFGAGQVRVITDSAGAFTEDDFIF